MYPILLSKAVFQNVASLKVRSREGWYETFERRKYSVFVPCSYSSLNYPVGQVRYRAVQRGMREELTLPNDTDKVYDTNAGKYNLPGVVV